MPIHDWTRVDAGLFHDFHQDWTIELRRSLNAGRLPAGYVALTDQQTGGPIPDVLTLNRSAKRTGRRLRMRPIASSAFAILRRADAIKPDERWSSRCSAKCRDGARQLLR